MMSTTATQQSTIQIRVDEATKSEAMELFNKLGLDMSTAVKMFLKKAVDTKSLPFVPSLTVNGFTPEQEEKMLKEVRHAAEHGKSFASAEELFKDILGKDYHKYA